MSLKYFHLLFIALSALLAFGFTFWCWGQQHIPAGISALVMGVGLLIYGAFFIHKIKSLPVWSMLVGLSMVTLARPAAACLVCAGDPNAAMSRGIRAGLGGMLGLVLVVLLAFGVFFIYLLKRSQMARPSENKGA